MNAEFYNIPNIPDYIQGTNYSLYSESINHICNVRWGNVLPLNSTRVKLSGGGCDFVEANYVSLGNNYQCIVGSAPLPAMFGQWWKMIFQQDITQIYCLTRETENGKPKMNYYWSPEKGGTITCRDDVENYIIHTIEYGELLSDLVCWSIRATCGQVTKTVNIYHYTGWPDFGVPSDTLAVKRLIHLALDPQQRIVIHCSAGRGRSGVLIAALRCLLTGDTPASSVETLRRYRTSVVQSESQYEFLKILVSNLGTVIPR